MPQTIAPTGTAACDDTPNLPAASGYSSHQIRLHWAIAGLTMLQLLVNGGMEEALEDRMTQAEGLGAFALVHIATGLLILGLTTLRFWLRLRDGAPEPAKPVPTIFAVCGHLAHLALYGFLFAMPLTGIVAYYGLNDLAAELHEWLALALTWLIVAHAAGAFFEHGFLGNRTLLRMLIPKSAGHVDPDDTTL